MSTGQVVTKHQPPATPTPSHAVHPTGRAPGAQGTPEGGGGGDGGGEWRRRSEGPGTQRSLVMARQLDMALTWLRAWDLTTRCVVMEGVVRASDPTQFTFLLTVTQPWLHRDHMYRARSLFPRLHFPPLSTPLSRKVKETAQRAQGSRFYRVDSCHPHPVHPSTPSSCTLPSLPSSSCVLRSSPPCLVAEASQTYVRRHVQNESCPRAVEHLSTDTPLNTAHVKQAETKKWSTQQKQQQQQAKTHTPLPPHAQRILTWYTQCWDELERHTFLYHLLLSLDPREHYYLSACLLQRQHVDFLTQLPEPLALHVLSFLSPRDLVVVSRVSKAWHALAEADSVWQTKCGEVRVDVPMGGGRSWKEVYRNNHLLRNNWAEGRCKVKVFTGHKLSVLAVCVDEGRVASGSADASIMVWDLTSGARLHVLTGHTKGVWCLQFFTRHLLLSGSYDSTVRIWNLRSGTLSRTLLGHGGPVWCLAVHRNCLVSGSNDKTAKVWDIGRCVLENSLVGHKAAVFSVDVNTAGDTVFTGSADRTVRMWDKQSGQCVRRIRVSSKAAIMSVSVSHGYFACCHGTTVCLYQGNTLVASFKEHLQRVEAVKLRVDPDTGQGLIVSGGQDGLVKYWDIQSPDSLQTFRGHTDAVNCLYCDPVRIITASQDHKLRLWEFVL
ncbi:uncharacterized protein LOC143282842 [Babylonia areolata]|uniref:uncharacterized protein LOC143282842 n=1 Tax=Babylonia areolata TaxID=304850 RepID=UPI003FCF3273